MSKLPQGETLLFSALFNERGVLATLIVTQVVATILAFAPFVEGDSWQSLGVISLFSHLTVLVSISALYSFRGVLQKKPQTTQLFAFFISFLVSTALFSVLCARYFLDIANNETSIYFVLRNCLIVFLITALFVQFLLIYFEKEQQTKALSRAELDALQARIRPHFLYNSLNTAAELTHHDADAAEQAILALAALSQAAMRSGQRVSLEDELTLSKQYVALETWRFGSRLKLNWQVPADLPDISIPCLTLQPLIENAVCHGVEPSETGAVISVELHVTTGYLTLIVSNPITHNEALKRPNNGMALENIRQRLFIYYKEKAQLAITQKEDVFRVKVVIPKQFENPQ
ncbi:sensor histidine kinase [Pseudoalteromonas sp. UBA2102]|uniref:sensor histidine kinase n=1 Tax=Pseudoalteromonas sp. UBA2102 TaxID=1947291 RepID=UPI00257C1FE2|nr:histidine kinase [Pseudoalteromonas sp. UBA2102]|tara:strand:- start:1964 stop:2998 length:1035 start_codon:yes stop_codon:yes gene_type:complete